MDTMNPCTCRDFLHAIVLGLALAASGFLGVVADAQEAASALRVASVTPAAVQPQEQDGAVIFYDDFSQAPTEPVRYNEVVSEKGSFLWTPDGGLRGGAMRCQFEKDQVAAGALHVLLGRNPIGAGHRPEETFREVYWRVYVRHEPGWQGNPAKLARATCMAGRDYSQGMIAHVWGGKGDVLCIDPATGIRDSRKVTTRYNDFANLKWLGSRNTQTSIFSPAESGRWVCVESHVRLNTPGRADGVFELWVDGKLEAARTDLDWHGEWQEYGINAVFLENYCNTDGRGSVKRQARWFDNFVISTRPIGPVVAEATPTVSRTGPDDAPAWEAQVATDAEGRDIVWQSIPGEGKGRVLTIGAGQGIFTGSRAGKLSLAAGTIGWLRVRQVGEPGWSPWHAPFVAAPTARK